MRKICSTLGVLIAFFAVLSAQQTQFARLELYTPIKTGTASIEVNKEYVLAVRVRNLGTSTWKGGLFLKVNGQDIGSEYATIPAEKNKAFLIRGRWTPSHGGQHKVELFYQTNGNGRGRLVAPGEYSNPQYLYVENNQDLQPKICLVATTGFTRSIIELGQSVRYVSTIGNKGNKDWSGVLYLKSEGKDIHHWSVRINKGASQNIIFDYLPTSIGTREYYLYAQEGGVGRGTLIDGNGYSNPVSLTVKAASKGKVSLSRAMGFGGATTLEQGKSSRFTATVSSDKDWSGVLFLKNGSQNIHHWSVRLTKGVAQTVTFDYTPTTTGTQVLTLYAQEGGEGAGVVVDRNGYSNPIRISVKAASKGKVSLSRAMGFGGATTLEQGKSSRFTATVSSDKDWSGVLFLKNGSQNIHHWSVRLTKGVAQIVTFDYTPTTTGTQVLTLYAQEGGEGAGIKVDANGYSNPIQIIVKESLVDLALQMQSAIRIYPEGERAPSESIPQGKKCIVKVSLYNKQSSAYRGVLCLKDLKKDDILFYFSPNPTKIVAKSARQIEGSFIPRTTGTYRYGLFYKEGNSWLPVQGQGGLSSEVSFTVGSISESHSYKLVGVSTPTVEKTGVRVDNLQIGTSYGVVCLIKNEGKNVFSGEICLRRVYDQKILQKKMVSKISSMHSEKVSFAFIPTEADYNKTTATQYEICSKLPTGNWQAIPNTRFSVDIVYKKEKGDYLLGVKIRKLIPDINELVPQKGDGKTTLFYTFRILDSKNVPVPDIRLEAKVSKKQPRGTWSQKDDTIFGFEIEEKESNIKSLVNDPVLQSTLSDADGYVTLAVPFETCISQTAVDHYCFCLGARTSENVEIKILENDFDRPFVLRKEVDILPLKSFKIKLENSFKDEKASKKGKFSIIPKFSASWDIEEGHFVNPSCSFGVEGSIGISGKISTSKKDNREIKKATAAFSAGAEAGLEVALEGEVEMNQDLMLEAPLFFTEIVCRLASQLVNDIGGRWSSGLGNYLESYADDVAKVREQLDETTSDISASLKASTDIGGYVELNFLEKLMRKNQAPIFHNKSSIKAKAEYELTSKFHNSSIPSNSTQNISHQLKFMVQGENAFGYSNREMDKILKESYGGSFDMEIIGGYVWSNKYEKEYNNENFFAPTLQKVSSKCMIGPFAKVKTDINLFDYNSGGKLIILNGGISAEVSTECSNKGVVGGELLSYMSNMSMSYSKQTPLEANCLTVSHNPLGPEVVLDFMQREYDPSKLSSYRQTSSRDIQKDYCFTKQSKLDLDLSFYAKEFKIGNLSLIDKKSEKKLELPFSLELNFPKLSHSYYYAAGNRMITTDTTYFNPDTPQSIALVKDKVNKMYNKTIEVMQEGIAKATDWALEKGMALLTTAGDKTVEFVNRVRDYLGSLFRSAELRANPQTKVSHIRFVIPGEGKVFNNGTSYNFSYAYPAGEATGICKQDGDEFVIVSDIFFIRAIYNNQSLLQAPNGTFAVSPEIGVDDLSTLSLNPNSKVTLYYLPLNAKNNEWQRIGEAKGTYQCSGLGNYALGVSLQQDREAPVVTCFPDREHNSLLVEVEDNIGIRWSSLSIVVNGVARNYRKTSKHTQVLVPLAEGELAEGAIPTIVITVEDLAHNKGSYEQYDPNILPVTEAAISGSLPICYPNPADTYLDVRLSDSWLGAAYYLYSFDGKLLKYGIVSETLQRLSLPEDTSEMCYIRFQMKDKTYTQAIIRIQ